MAQRSPGLYFNENDNTAFKNMVTTEGTTVAVIGFAKKGPIGEPVEITSYSNYVSLFGTPIEGQYSGLAVKNILAYGGKVIFVRVADLSTATKSKVIVKNGKKASDGKLIINSTDAITVGTDGYINGAVYTAVISSDEGKKRVMVRAPATGKLSQTNLYSQLLTSLDDSFGYDEFKIKTNEEGNLEDNIYSFSITNVFDKDEEFGPYFIKTTSTEEPVDLAETIDKAINIDNNEGNKGVTNPYAKFYIVGTYGVNASEEEGVFAPTIYEDSNSIVLGDDVFVSADRLIRNSITLKYTYTLYNKKTQNALTINTTNDITYSEFAKALNNKLELDTAGILHAKFVEGKKEVTEVEGVSTVSAQSYSYLLVYSTGIDEFNFSYDVEADNPIFYGAADFEASLIPEAKVEGSGTITGISSNIADISDETNVEKFRGLLVKEVEVGPKENLLYHLAATYNADTGSIVIAPTSISYMERGTEQNAVESIEKTIVKLGKATDAEGKCEFGDYLFDEEKGQGVEIANLYGDKKVDIITIEKNLSSKRIEIYKSGSPLCLDLEKFECDEDKEVLDEEIYKDLFDIIGEVVDRTPEIKEVAVYKEEGISEIKDYSKDMVIFEATELGSGTTNTSIEVVTFVSPLDETDVRHDINVFVGGVLKETFEGVSYNMKDEKYFVKLINEDPENGGSEFVKVKVIKNEAGTEVNLPDSANIATSGFYTLGAPVNEIYNKAKTSDISDKAYTSYDFEVGENGITEGHEGDEMFIEILDPESKLANQDLFSFHILITPDNINEEVQNAAIALCEKLGDGMYIADCPQGLTKKGVIDWHNGRGIRSASLNSNFTATYWPWVKVYDSNTSKYVWVMPSVVMAAQYINVDKNYGPWYAPAGEVNGSISAIDIETYPNRTDRDDLYTNGNRINPFVMYNDGTILAYGEKTTQRKETTLTKIHTRRMLIELKKEIKTALKGYIFMPSDGSNINSMVSNVTTILERYKAGKAISYYNIDTSRNTIETLQQDVIYLDVNVVPMGCIEEVDVTCNLNKSEQTVTVA